MVMMLLLLLGYDGHPCHFSTHIVLILHVWAAVTHWIFSPPEFATGVEWVRFVLTAFVANFGGCLLPFYD